MLNHERTNYPRNHNLFIYYSGGYQTLELILDVETTTYAKGNPFSQRNKLCYVGLRDSQQQWLYPVEYDDSPYGEALGSIREKVRAARVLIGFNIKFDLHWIKRYGIDFKHCRIWDCQLVHFILRNQSVPYPSLNDVCAYYSLDSKLDVVSKYWDSGIDTREIPREILEDYLGGDLSLTYQVYLKQKEELSKASLPLQRLVSLHNQDLTVLEEIEYNGMVFDELESKKLGEDCAEQISEMDQQLFRFHGVDNFNLNSGDHLSCLLYGGTVVIPRKEIVGEYKTGPKKGEPKLGWVNIETKLPKLVEPAKNSELKKEGYWATNEATLKSLKATGPARKLIETLLERSVLEKRVSTYYFGLPSLREEMDWEPGMIHGVLNQCVARTGRLSSSKPNLQNFDGKIKSLFRSRYE